MFCQSTATPSEEKAALIFSSSSQFSFARSLEEELCQELDEATKKNTEAKSTPLLQKPCQGGPLVRARARQRALMLADRYNWALEDSQNLWACGPADGCGANIFVRGRSLRQGPPGSSCRLMPFVMLPFFNSLQKAIYSNTVIFKMSALGDHV